MFTSIKSILLNKTKRLGIKNQVKVIDDCRRIECVINGKINQNFKIKVLKYKNNTVYIKTNNFQLSNEIKLIEFSIKNDLKKYNISIKEIKYVV
ncbi:MAG: hypothetical protein AAB614_01060 [Patescibacteria group bacterium]|mgnify:CR=1 FL=1